MKNDVGGTHLADVPLLADLLNPYPVRELLVDTTRGCHLKASARIFDHDCMRAPRISMKDGRGASEREGEGERHVLIKHTLPEGKTVNKVIFDLHGLLTEEAAERVWAVFLELGWVSE